MAGRTRLHHRVGLGKVDRRAESVPDPFLLQESHGVLWREWIRHHATNVEGISLCVLLVSDLQGHAGYFRPSARHSLTPEDM